MPFLSNLVIFALGLVVGSFLNVVIYRYNTGRSAWRALGGRSRCLACARGLRWFELLPLLSFLAQGGRCRTCRSKISWQYPLIELSTGLLFLGTAWQYLVGAILSPAALWTMLLQLVILSLLVVIAVYDLRHKIIPDGPVFAFIGLAFLAAAARLNLGVPLRFNLAAPLVALRPNFLAGLGLFAFFWALWLVSRGRWMGFGDAKLALGVGFLLGPRGGVAAIVLAFWLGALAGLLLILTGRLFPRLRAFGMKSELPFAPFIILGGLLVLFFNLNPLPPIF